VYTSRTAVVYPLLISSLEAVWMETKCFGLILLRVG
jgi:hypothetical protein